eukprot:Gb_33763 [translate_table: standard]
MVAYSHPMMFADLLIIVVPSSGTVPAVARVDFDASGPIVEFEQVQFDGIPFSGVREGRKIRSHLCRIQTKAVSDAFYSAISEYKSGTSIAGAVLVEPFGLTLIEAVAHGLPMVATKNGGPASIDRILKNGGLKAIWKHLLWGIHGQSSLEFFKVDYGHQKLLQSSQVIMGQTFPCITDGHYFGATLDHNALCPGRFYVTYNGQVIMASEVGVMDIPLEYVCQKGGLNLCMMLLIYFEKHVDDEALKKKVTLKDIAEFIPEAERAPALVIGLVKVNSLDDTMENMRMVMDLNTDQEGEKFQVADRIWKDIMKKTAGAPRCLDTSKDVERLQKMSEANILLEIINKGLASYLEELEQRSQDQIQKLQQSMTDLQYELSEAHMKMESSEMAYTALKAKETYISSLQMELLKQAEVIETGQLDLQHVQDHLQCQLEKEQNLEEALFLLRNKEKLITSQARLEELSVVTRTSEHTINDLLENPRLSEGKVEICEKQFVNQRLRGGETVKITILKGPLDGSLEERSRQGGGHQRNNKSR